MLLERGLEVLISPSGLRTRLSVGSNPAVTIGRLIIHVAAPQCFSRD